MAQLHKGKYGPRASPIDWYVDCWTRAAMPLWLVRTMATSTPHTPVDDYLGDNGGRIVEASVGDAGEIYYLFDEGSFMGKAVTTEFRAKILDGVNQRKVTLSGWLDGVLNIRREYSTLPATNTFACTFLNNTPDASFTLNAANWNWLNWANWSYTSWGAIPPP